MSRRDLDEKRRESDFVLTIGKKKIHIEAKHALNRRTFFWSGLQYEKARDLEKKDASYFIAILYPKGNESYEIYWIWQPLVELLGAFRDVQWEGETVYRSVDSDRWEVSDQRPSQVPTKRYNFRIRLSEQIVEGLESDTGTLDALRRRIQI